MVGLILWQPQPVVVQSKGDPDRYDCGFDQKETFSDGCSGLIRKQRSIQGIIPETGLERDRRILAQRTSMKHAAHSVL